MLVDLPEDWMQTHPNQAYIHALRNVLADTTDGYSPYLGPQRIAQGVYLAHINFDHEIEHLIKERYPFDSYQFDDPQDCGVCDDYTQVLARWPELDLDPRRFIISLSVMTKADQPAEGGWRWHKWGEYIGTKNPKHEYLYDEQDIDQVTLFHILELKS